MFVMSCGVIRMYCLRSDAFAVSIYPTAVSYATPPPDAHDYTHHHPHADPPVDGIHEHVEFVCPTMGQLSALSTTDIVDSTHQDSGSGNQ
jgi:hypothetical protein